MSRRQRKNRKLNDSSSVGDETSSSSSSLASIEKHQQSSSSAAKRATAAVSSSGKLLVSPSKRQQMLPPMSEAQRKRATTTPPLKEHIKLNIPEHELASILRDRYMIKECELLDGGYPLPCKDNQAFIFIRSFGECFTGKTEHQLLNGRFDVNAQEFVPTPPKRLVIINKDDGLTTTAGTHQSISTAITTTVESVSGDSGQGSGSSSPPSSSDDTDIGEDGQFFTIYNDEEHHSEGDKIRECLVNVKTCVRCHSNFYMNESGDYYSKDNMCRYHPGKAERKNGMHSNVLSCCDRPAHYQGCTTNKYHVWTGLENGYNGPYDGFVTTAEPTHSESDGNYGVYAIDCEMCYTLFGLELTKVTLIRSDGRLIYEKLVKPTAPIVDYNTRFSGITEKLLSGRSVRTLREVQTELLRFINARTILIGHAINNDLRVLKMIHRNVIDTSVVFPHRFGLPYRLSLKHIVKSYLHRDIQTNDQGHCSYEDSRACLEALLWNVRRNYYHHNNKVIYNNGNMPISNY